MSRALARVWKPAFHFFVAFRVPSGVIASWIRSSLRTASIRCLVKAAPCLCLQGWPCPQQHRFERHLKTSLFTMILAFPQWPYEKERKPKSHIDVWGAPRMMHLGSGTGCPINFHPIIRVTMK